jgi:tetrahydromethanopterin S-methyltransferase subunit B
VNWSRITKLTVVDMLFVFGVLVGLAIAALIALASVLWVARIMLGG